MSGDWVAAVLIGLAAALGVGTIVALWTLTWMRLFRVGPWRPGEQDLSLLRGARAMLRGQRT